MPNAPPQETLVLNAQDLVLQALPTLQIGPGHTTSSAIHKVSFTGKMRPWDNFVSDVESLCNAFQWKGNRVANTDSAPLPHHLSREQISVGDETGAQGRFHQNVGQVMGGVFLSEGLDIKFGDFKSCVLDEVYNRVPDSVMRRAAGSPLAVGEMKSPWVSSHRIRDTLLAGQIARYMRDLKLKYAYLSNYEEAMFFCQNDPLGAHQTELLYSDVIDFSNRAVTGSSVTIRQCFFYVGVCAAQQPNHTTSESRTTGWVKDMVMK
ncbi:hypothetical protein ASPTUDRAFT_52982 [Aspergillus tubingensis CBS 134.48]|uniref:Uncharacterized protein n=1 Tax=Aspergillus tubingensis (strain CBS 134.48) TaxID=767770 RepID=A0A1L9NPV3_ASPTC|nr:hypothetical protein ASPTUDRAFT_52982 [Aspergillus tubingensis CBS 134.48]